MSSLLESSKKAAAFRAVDEYILPTHKVVGIGSGSTVVYVVERISQRPELHKIVYIPTGFQSKILIIKAGLILGSIEQYPEIDIAIDGADEVDANLNAIKGGGACHFHEKLVAEAAKTFVIVADYRKQSQYLGTSWRQGVPIEVVPPAYKAVERALARLSIIPSTVTLRMGKAKAGPVVTDNGNFVIDADFGEIKTDVGVLLREIKLLTGVVEVGLFVGMAERAYFGLEDGNVRVLDRPA